jgi:hypothetical protein
MTTGKKRKVMVARNHSSASTVVFTLTFHPASRGFVRNAVPGASDVVVCARAHLLPQWPGLVSSTYALKEVTEPLRPHNRSWSMHCRDQSMKAMMVA